MSTHKNTKKRGPGRPRKILPVENLRNGTKSLKGKKRGRKKKAATEAVYWEQQPKVLKKRKYQKRAKPQDDVLNFATASADKLIASANSPSAEMAFYEAAERLLNSGRKEVTLKNDRFFVQFQAIEIIASEHPTDPLSVIPLTREESKSDPLEDPVGFERDQIGTRDVA